MLPLLAMLAGCGEPSVDDIGAAIGHRNISDVSCAGANGKPGYVCTYTYGGMSLTQRLVKADGGRWMAVD